MNQTATNHEIVIGDARDMSHLPDESIESVVTSPPYPMIKMWDETFRSMHPEIGSALERGDGEVAFELMHCQLDRVWKECYRVLKRSGRNSVGFEIDANFEGTIERTLTAAPDIGGQLAEERLESHLAFVERCKADCKPLRHRNWRYGFPVMTSQEADLVLYRPVHVRRLSPNRFETECAPADIPLTASREYDSAHRSAGA